jgi:hypothetical protein
VERIVEHLLDRQAIWLHIVILAADCLTSYVAGLLPGITAPHAIADNKEVTEFLARLGFDGVVGLSGVITPVFIPATLRVAPDTALAPYFQA